MKDSKLYILYSTDEWKSSSSKCLCCVTGNPSRIREVIRQLIREGDMEYTNGSKAEQLEALDRDWDDAEVLDINNALRYGYIQEAEDGEVLC